MRPAGLTLLALAVAAAVFLLTAPDDEPAPTARAAPHPGKAVFVRAGCGGCHRLAAAGTDSQIGPDLDARLASYDAARLRARIVLPVPEDIMPDDYGRRLSPRELDALVAFLLR